MNAGPLLFLGILMTTMLSFWGLIIGPAFQLGRQDLVDTGAGRYPTGRSGLAERGAQVYRSLGCAECHTQQVRPDGYGTDIARGWGVRRTVAQDHLRDRPVMIGSLRLGPDLANVGMRRPDARWHLEHLYNPQKVVPRSTMPPYRFLFEDGKLDRPTEDADALVAYLLSLRSDVSLFEMPLPAADTNAAPADAGTNAPATTNAPAPTP